MVDSGVLPEGGALAGVEAADALDEDSSGVGLGVRRGRRSGQQEEAEDHRERATHTTRFGSSAVELEGVERRRS